MTKLSFIQFYPYDWINDTRELSPEAKGAWIDALCLMWNAKQRGRWEGTHEEFARATGIPWEIAPRIITEIGKKCANLTLSNNIITLENRRMLNEQKAHENNRIRQHRHYHNAKPNANLTDKTLDVRRYTLYKGGGNRSSPFAKRREELAAQDLQGYMDKWLQVPRILREQKASEIAVGLKIFRLGFRTEDDIYRRIMEAPSPHISAAPPRREVAPKDPTEIDLKEMHQVTLKAFGGVCRTKDCVYCTKKKRKGATNGKS